MSSKRPSRTEYLEVVIMSEMMARHAVNWMESGISDQRQLDFPTTTTKTPHRLPSNDN